MLIYSCKLRFLDDFCLALRKNHHRAKVSDYLFGFSLVGVWTSRHNGPRQSSPGQLRARLDELLAEARKNEHKMRRFQALELTLFGLHSLHELLRALLYPDRSQFDWDIITIVLVDAEYELRRVLEGDDDIVLHPNLSFVDSDRVLQSLYPPLALTPIIGVYKASAYRMLFSNVQEKPASVMLLPLARQGKLIGSLNIGSFDMQRFARGYRTDFMKHLAAVVSICIENATNMERIKLLGLTDTLTGANNRRYFDQRLEEEIEISRRSHQPLACLMLDMDHFKHINDQYGHQTGDRVLKQATQLARAELRGSDVLARYGGEEFVALLTQTDTSVAREVAERIRRSVANQTFTSVDGQVFRLTLSAGIATTSHLAGGVMNGAELVAYADKALYDAKQGGRNRVVSA
ncbi:sensor domain-containing diguanylate cyclase [Gammaproteobacteria bacterium AH-315-C21]|nr:sensor domain-containing diguanylate cyclase [Gammaproteobacteria bacterium AH-315-C21]